MLLPVGIIVMKETPKEPRIRAYYPALRCQSLPYHFPLATLIRSHSLRSLQRSVSVAEGNVVRAGEEVIRSLSSLQLLFPEGSVHRYSTPFTSLRSVRE